MRKFLWILLCSTAWATTPSWVGTSHKANAAGGGSAQTSVALPAITSQSSGNMNIVTITGCSNSVCNGSTSGFTLSATDGAGNTYTPLFSSNGVNVDQAMGVFCADPIAASASNIITVHASSTGLYYLTGNASEWTGQATSCAALVDASGYIDFASTSSSPLTVTTTGNVAQANEAVYAFANGATYTGAGSGYALINNSGNGSDEWKASPSTGTTASATFPFTGTINLPAAVILTFKSPGATVTNPPTGSVF